MWMNRNAEAIYASKPWKIYGDNLASANKPVKGISETDLATAKKQSEDFNERTIASPAYPHDEVRFTTKSNTLYVFVLNPAAGLIELPSLGLSSPYNSKKIISIKLLGSAKKISFKQDKDKLQFHVPELAGDKHTKVFAIKGVL
ncbi:alpha-L-fucosidase C-terminal domain-containing protein [Mucilaginibacter sp.]|uniref:alpha-L-fucosidase C-terminal domain-containing protein n=1 Tax=Mucilaginibacter sp. TaxID=1882438 RepID=UPI0034470AF4